MVFGKGKKSEKDKVVTVSFVTLAHCKSNSLNDKSLIYYNHRLKGIGSLAKEAPCVGHKTICTLSIASG